MVEINKIEAGYYEVKDEYGKVFKVIKDSYLGGWGIFDGPTYSNLIITKQTKKDCIEFIEGGCSYKDLSRIDCVPKVEPHDKFRFDNNEWTVNDVMYSTVKGKWIIKASYYNDSIDSSSSSFDEDDFYNIIGE